jgi:hypothetical protein
MTFANAPVSLGETRALKMADGRLWTPRDALVAMLRDIDEGKEDPTDIVICFREKGSKHGNDYRARFLAAGPEGVHVALGLLARVSFMMQERD